MKVPIDKPETIELDLNREIISKPNPPPMPILFRKLKKMYQNNTYTIKQLKDSKIEPINVNGSNVDNLYELLRLNQTSMHRKGSNFNITAPTFIDS